MIKVSRHQDHKILWAFREFLKSLQPSLRDAGIICHRMQAINDLPNLKPSLRDEEG